MRLLVAPEFSEKLADMNPETLVDVKTAIFEIEQSSKEQLVSNAAFIPLTVSQDLFAFRVGASRIFVSLGTDDEGDYALILDLAARERRLTPNDPVRRPNPKANPKFDTRINPKFNSRINPRFNSRINPRFNSRINPKFNSKINPRFNSLINPRFNSRINPKFNSQINPKFNSSLNPKFNWSINPLQNRALENNFVYDLDANVEAFIVIADDLVRLVFDTTGAWINYAVSHSNDGFVVFDPDGEWVAHWEDNGAGSWNRFDLENEWTGFVI